MNKTKIPKRSSKINERSPKIVSAPSPSAHHHRRSPSGVPMMLAIGGFAFTLIVLILSCAAMFHGSLSITQRVARHILVPTTEQPVIAQIKDLKLVQQNNSDFFRNAEKGDVLLAWSDKTVLYSPRRDRIVAVLSTDDMTSSTLFTSTTPAAAEETATTTPAQLPTAPEIATIEVRNGTRTPGLGRNLAAKLTAQGLKVTRTTDAARKGSATTTISQISSKLLPETLLKLVGLTGAEILPLPTYENTSAADFVVIIGEDYLP